MKLKNLIAQAAALVEPQEPLKVGDVVVWKDGLRNKRTPNYGQPVVVSRVYESPLIDEDEGCGSAYFNEPIDFAHMSHDKDGDAIEFHGDSRRFRKLTDEEIAARLAAEAAF